MFVTFPLTVPPAAVTERVTTVEWETDPLVPLTVSEYEPEGVLADVATLRFEVPAPEIVVPLKVAVAPTGRPLTAKATGEANPFAAVTVTANGLASCPWIVDREVGVAAMAKSGGSVTTSVAGMLWESEPLDPVIVNG
jgi:hypothetical protein